MIGARGRQSSDRAAAIAYGALGMLLGLGLGAVGGLARGSASAAAAAGLAGLVLGGAAGARGHHAGTAGVPCRRPRATDEDAGRDLGLALATHGGIWISVGVAAGLGLGLGLGGGARLGRAVVGGLLGAVIATVIYEFGGAVGFPLSESFRPRAVTAGPRLLAHLSVALCVSAAALWAVDYLSLRRAAATIVMPPPDAPSVPPRFLLVREPCLKRGFLARKQPGQELELFPGTGRVAVRVQEALDQEHPREPAERIEAERLVGFPDCGFPVLFTHLEVGQALVQARRPGVQGQGPAGVSQGGPKLVQLDGVLHALVDHLLVVGGRLEDDARRA